MVLRQRGVFDLSVERLMEQLSRITPAVGRVQGVVIISAPPLQADENGGIERPAVSGSVDVTVKISSNCSKAKRELLERAKLSWNGKEGWWIGRVDRSHLDELRAVFGARLAIEPAGEAAVVTPASAGDLLRNPRRIPGPGPAGAGRARSCTC